MVCWNDFVNFSQKDLKKQRASKCWVKKPNKTKTKNKELAKFTKEITTKTVSQEVNKPLTL